MSAEGITFTNISATTATFTLRGGNYGATAVWASAGNNDVHVSRLAADGTTFVNVLSLNSGTMQVGPMPGGTYKVVVDGPTAIYVDIALIN